MLKAFFSGWTGYQLTDIFIKVMAGLVIAALQIRTHNQEVASQRDLSNQTTAVDIVRFYTRDTKDAIDSLNRYYGMSKDDPRPLTQAEVNELYSQNTPEGSDKYNRARDLVNYIEFITRSWDENTADRKILRDSFKANFDRAFIFLKPLLDRNAEKNPQTSWGIIACVLNTWKLPKSETAATRECSNKTSP